MKSLVIDSLRCGFKLENIDSRFTLSTYKSFNIPQTHSFQVPRSVRNILGGFFYNNEEKSARWALRRKGPCSGIWTSGRFQLLRVRTGLVRCMFSTVCGPDKSSEWPFEPCWCTALCRKSLYSVRCKRQRGTRFLQGALHKTRGLKELGRTLLWNSRTSSRTWPIFNRIIIEDLCQSYSLLFLQYGKKHGLCI